MKGGWESVRPMFQTMLGDETPEDCRSVKWSDAAASAVYALVLALIAVGVI